MHVEDHRARSLIFSLLQPHIWSFLRAFSTQSGSLANQLSQPRKVVAMQDINYVIDLAGSMFERFPPRIYATALFVLCCGLVLVDVVVSLKRSACLQEQIDELRCDVRLLESEEGRRMIESINLSSRSGIQMHQEEVSSIAPFSIIPLHAAPISHNEPDSCREPGPAGTVGSG